MRFQSVLAFLAYAVVITIWPSHLHAAYEGGSRIVKKLYVDGPKVWVFFDPPPVVCAGDSYFNWGHMHLRFDRPQFDALYALLLSHNTTGAPIAGIWYVGTSCSNAGTPELTGAANSK